MNLDMDTALNAALGTGGGYMLAKYAIARYVGWMKSQDEAVKALVGDVAVVKAQLEQLKKDINHAFEKIRESKLG